MGYSLIPFLNEVEEYRDLTYNLLGDTINPSSPSGNSALYEGHLYALTEGFTEPLLMNAYRALRVERGLINRKPKAEDEEMYDDYIGLALKASVASDFLYYGGLNYGFFDNNNPSKTLTNYIKRAISSPTYLRFNFYLRPGFKAHLKLCAGEKLGLVEALIWSVSTLSPIYGKGSSSKLLAHLKLWAAKRQAATQSKLVQKIINFTAYYFYNRINIAEEYAAYFGNEHPFAKWAREKYR